MPADLTSECRAGYEASVGAACPHLFSSDAWLAWHAGRHLGGMSMPESCFKSRGFSVRVRTSGGSQVLVAFRGEQLTPETVDRT